MKTQLKTILTAAAIVIAQLFAPPALAADDGHPTGFDVGAEIAFANFDCPAGLTCPATEDTAPQGIRNGVLVAQSEDWTYTVDSDLQAFFMHTLNALNALTWMNDIYHDIEFHSSDLADLQQAKENWRENYRECVAQLSKALAELNAHQRRHNDPPLTEHPFVVCPSDEPGQ